GRAVVARARRGPQPAHDLRRRAQVRRRPSAACRRHAALRACDARGADARGCIPARDERRALARGGGLMNRIAAIVLADVRIRFRRLSTLIVFVLLSSCAYLWVPDPRTGRALIEIDGKRALYNSAAIGMGTAAMATIFVGLIGYYVISNALRRDVSSRCGFVLASTGMRSSEYLAGKFLGNVVFLTTFLGGFMITSMGMLVLRGEAPLEP